MEHWAPIEDFPGYEVSSHGRIRNAYGRLLGIYDNGHGVLQVVMRRDGKSHARAVHKLVATAFICPPPYPDSVPIHIDGDWTNMRVENLDWKPLWFATKHTRQARRTEPRDNRRVRMIKTRQEFENALECAKAIGGLEELVILTAQNRHGATYMGSAFEFIRD